MVNTKGLIARAGLEVIGKYLHKKPPSLSFGEFL